MKYLNNLIAIILSVLMAIPAQAQVSSVTEQSTDKNYVLNGGFENSKAGWVAFKNTAQPIPTTGLGGTPAITITSSTSAPITGKGSGIITKNATNLQGEGISSNFIVDGAAKGRVLTISGLYQIISGTYNGGTSTTDSDLEAYIYDVDAAQIIQPAGYKLDGGVIGQTYSLAATFQTNTTSTNYRLILHVATTSASAFSVKIDQIKLGVGNRSQGPPVTDWKAYTPTTAGFGTTNPAATQVLYRRVGDSLEVEGRIGLGTTAATVATLSLPPGLSAASSFVQNSLVGSAYMQAVNAASDQFDVLTTGGQNYVTFGQTNTNNGLGNIVGSQFASNLTLLFHFTVPIQGWSSNVTMSDSSDTKVVAARVYGASLTLSGTDQIAIYSNVDFDTTGSYSKVTGIYTCPSPGKYKAAAYLAGPSAARTTNIGTYINLYKNGTLASTLGASLAQTAATFRTQPSGSAYVDCIAGDQLTIRISDSSGAAIDQTSSASNWASFEKVGSSSQIAASESVNARYTNTAGTNIPNTGENQLAYGTKDYDSHGAYNPTTGVYTVPVSGKYRISATTNYVNAGYSTSNLIYTGVYKNGAAHSYGPYIVAPAGQTSPAGSSIVTTVNCVAGDTLIVTATNLRSVGSVPLITTAGTNHFEIERVGN
jgi:hypothetical protein